MEKKNNSNDSGMGGKMAAGIGFAALAAAAAGAVYLYGTDAGKKKRKEISTWSLRMKADVIDRMEKMKDWSEGSYNEMIDTVASKYENLKNIDKGEVQSLVTDLKKHWKVLKKHAEGTTKSKPKRKAISKPKSTSSESKAE